MFRLPMCHNAISCGMQVGRVEHEHDTWQVLRGKIIILRHGRESYTDSVIAQPQGTKQSTEHF
jgi:hypothetical protein